MFELKFAIDHRAAKKPASQASSVDVCSTGWKTTNPCICSSTKSTWIDKAGQLSVSPYTKTI